MNLKVIFVILNLILNVELEAKLQWLKKLFLKREKLSVKIEIIELNLKIKLLELLEMIKFEIIIILMRVE